MLYHCASYITYYCPFISGLKTYHMEMVLSMQGKFTVTNGLEYLDTLGCSITGERVLNTALIL